MENSKICTQCNIEKPLFDFCADKRIRGLRPLRNSKGYRSKCKDCCNANQTARWNRSSSAERERRNLWLLKVYKITADDYDKLFLEQKQQCIICLRDPISNPESLRHNRYYPIDHDHKTGEIRGILCHDCNVALGLLADSVDRITRLVLYLKGEL